MKIKLIAALLLITALSVGCSNEKANTETQESEVDIKELVNDYTVRNAVAASASITSSELIVTDDDKNVTTYDLPDDEFFVSIAPFVDSTHPCDIHSLTGCQGELVEEDFEVHIEDSEGNVILDEIKTTETNGFIDFWLPRDDTFTVTIKQDNKETVSEITTFDGDNTCITTMQLQ
ncbi:CueP family metal-binding protein [Sporosarcina ureae]|uniref:CueP family metal-binding protein n=1 Tax=Sporosarcina ureae TaxID=1571 RepID=UPI0026EB8C09|nr:CueP family metal-binding protein [Sporosarcina ureae]